MSLHGGKRKMTEYKLRYTTPYGLQIFQVFPDKESRDKAFELTGRAERIYAPGSVVRITNHIICITQILLIISMVIIL